MNSKFQLLFAMLCAFALLPARAQGDEDSHPSINKATVSHGTNGEVILALDAATQKTIGLQTAALLPAQLAPEIKGYGRVLDPAPLASLVADLTAAQAQSDDIQEELKRVKELAKEDNASQRALQAAEAAAVRDSTVVTSARARFFSGWGAVAHREDLPALVQSLVTLESALVQVDLPPDETTNVPLSARLVTFAEQSQPIDATYLGRATTVDPQLQGRGFIFLVTNNASRLFPGAAVTGYLAMPGAIQTGVVVPRDALVRSGGVAWVYVQSADDKFQRTEAVLEHPMEAGWFVHGGLRPGDKVVTVGAQELLSAETKNVEE